MPWSGRRLTDRDAAEGAPSCRQAVPSRDPARRAPSCNADQLTHGFKLKAVWDVGQIEFKALPFSKGVRAQNGVVEVTLN